MSRYKRVDHLERESLRANKELRDKYKSKLDFIEQYKFNITFENTNKDGYITEKAIDPFLAHTVPVYYGNYKTVERDFDMSKMLFFNPSDVCSLVRKIQELDNNEDMYNSFISGTLDHIGSRYNTYVEKFRSFIMKVHKVI